MAWTFKPKRAPKQKENNNKAFAAIAVAAAGAGMLGVYKLGTWSERGPEQRNDPESPWSFSALPPDPPPPPKPDNDKPEPKPKRPTHATVCTKEQYKDFMEDKRKVPVFYNVCTGKNKFGDFSWMIERHWLYKKTLFVFNDNEGQFKSQDCVTGINNAGIRPYQCGERPRATGIPTWDGEPSKGWKQLVDEAFAKIRCLLSKGLYNHVVYSGDEDGMLGSKQFNVTKEVKNYIMEKLRMLNSVTEKGIRRMQPNLGFADLKLNVKDQGNFCQDFYNYIKRLDLGYGVEFVNFLIRPPDKDGNVTVRFFPRPYLQSVNDVKYDELNCKEDNSHPCTIKTQCEGSKSGLVFVKGYEYFLGYIHGVRDGGITLDCHKKIWKGLLDVWKTEKFKTHNLINHNLGVRTTHFKFANDDYIKQHFHI